MFKLILGRAGTGKTTAVLSRLTKAGQRRKQVLIVPEAAVPRGGAGPVPGRRGPGLPVR
ncbi:MAG: hypothetical protein ACLT3D_12515 [Lawsonibacter sp.]